MDCETFLRVPQTHVIFSLATFTSSITTQPLSLGKRNVDTVTLCPESARLLLSLTMRQSDVGMAVQKLCELVKRDTKAQKMSTVISSAEEWAATINGRAEAQVYDTDAESEDDGDGKGV